MPGSRHDVGRQLRLPAGLLACCMLASCTVGPAFVRPAPPDVDAYTASPQPLTLAAGNGEPAQHVATGATISADWWQLFESPALESVVELAVTESPTLAAAEATLAQAEQVVRQTRGALYPQVDLTAQAEDQAKNLFALGSTVSYSPDVFGLTRRRVEQQQALADSQAYQLAAAYLTLTGNAVSQAIEIASARAQIRAAEDIVGEDERDLDLVQQKFDVGKIAESEVLTTKSLLANDRTLLPPLRQQIAAARDALSVLVGRFPGNWSPPDFELSELKLPRDLPLSLPSAFVRQRPDILASEAQVHAANAAVGVAVAQLYPLITLSASGGLESQTLDSLFTGSGLAWNFISGLTQPIFHGGALEAQKRASLDALDASLATYKQTILQAFGQVADTLQALQHDAELVMAERSALDTANASLSLQRITYAAGKTDLLTLLTAQRVFQEARLGYAHALGQRYLDTAQLYVALGGGWWAEGHVATRLTISDEVPTRPATGT